MFVRLAALLLLLFPCVAQAKWYEASSRHFVVYSEGTPESIELYARNLESFDKGVRELRKMSDPDIGPGNRVTVYFVRDMAAIRRLYGSNSVAGFYQPRAGNSVAFVPRRAGTESGDLDSRSVLFHEYSHHLMFSLYGDLAIPSWYSEGYAEFHATAKFQRNGGIVFGAVPVYRGWSLLDGPKFSAADLLTRPVDYSTDVEADAFYGRSWLLTHLISFTPARAKQFDAYLAAINAGTPLAEAARAFGDLDALDGEIKRYLRKSTVQSVLIPASRLAIGDVRVRPLTAGEEATMAVRIKSQNGVTEKTAPAVYADARRAAASYPDDPGAQIVLAEAAFDAEDFAGAEAAADRALAADPKAIRALVFKARARMGTAKAAGDTGKATWEAIRKLISAANRIDPNNPEPLVQFYRSFTEAGLAPNGNAVAALLQAHRLAPQDEGLRWTVALHWLNAGKLPEARRALGPIAFDPHGGEDAKRAAAVIARIDAGDAAGALDAVTAEAANAEDGKE